MTAISLAGIGSPGKIHKPELPACETICNINEQLDGARKQTLGVLHRIMLSLEEEEKLADADEKEIRKLDGEIDEIREAVLAPIGMMEKSLEAETVEADELFDAIGKRTTLLTIIISTIAVIISLLLALTITRGITKPIAQGVAFAEKIAEGDLTEELNINRKDEIGILANALNKMTANLKKIVISIKDDSDNLNGAAEGLKITAQTLTEASESVSSVSAQVATSSEQMTTSIEQLSQGAQEQAATLEETSAAVEGSLQPL